jgi:hypothetical protein
VPSPQQFNTPEFKALQAEWAERLRASGFDDIEQPPPVRPGGDPARHRAYHRDFIRSDNLDARNLPLGDLLAAEDAETPPLLKRDTTDLWVSRFDVFAEALHHYKFRDRTDRAVARRLFKGETWEHIAARLHISRRRISRVQREIREWARGA